MRLCQRELPLEFLPKIPRTQESIAIDLFVAAPYERRTNIATYEDYTGKESFRSFLPVIASIFLEGFGNG